MPLQATSGAASYDAFGGGVAAVPNYIEDVFSTWLYTGNGSTQTINNGIDLAGKGGLVWTKGRSAITDNMLFDTVRGVQKELNSNKTNAEATNTLGITSFGATGYSMGSDGSLNGSGTTYASWTFREQPKFFDVVTYTGNGSASQLINHSLGSVPGMVICKNITTTAFTNNDWKVWHRGNGTNPVNRLSLNTTGEGVTFTNNYSSFTSTTFDAAQVMDAGTNPSNQNGAQYVAYLFAHNAGGFGLTGTDNVISCGSYTTDASGVITTPVNLAYEPQWIFSKRVDAPRDWRLIDSMRGNPVANGTQQYLYANLSNAESGSYGEPSPTSTGFTVTAATANSTYIYIAIRRGPMKVPTTGTSVFFPTAWTGSSTTRVNTTSFVTDLNISRMRQNISSGSNLGSYWVNRLAGTTQYLRSDSTNAEASQTNGLTSFASNTAVTFGTDTTVQAWNFDNNYRNYSFRRAPGFFDEVCYSGSGVAGNQTHNLGVAPELWIIKRRTGTGGWITGGTVLTSATNNWLRVDATSAVSSITNFFTTPTSTTFGFGSGAPSDNSINASGSTYVAYLFASCPGVSKVGSYTGNGTTQTINCGFLAGARFVMIKAASTTGNWVFADVNGINAGNDRALYMNNADVEGFAYDWIDIDSTGFIVNETAVIAANTNGVSYIYLAIA